MYSYPCARPRPVPAACHGYPPGLAALTVEPAGTVSINPIESPTGSGNDGGHHGPAMGGLGRGGRVQRPVGLGSGILSVVRERGEDADKLERREWVVALGVVPAELEDDDVLEELPLATTSSSGWSRRDGGTGGGCGRLEEMPRDRRGRVGL